MIRVLIADNYPLSLNGVSAILKKEFEKIQIYETDNIRKADKLAAGTKIDLLILAQSEIGKNSLSQVRRLKNSYPDVPILVMCIYPESTFTYKVIKAGASAYLSRNCDIPEFVDAVEKLLSGQEYISVAAAKNLIEKISKQQKKANIDQLSTRELQILKLIAAGKPNKTIAQETRLIRTTISTYRKRILQKLHLKNNIQIARFAMEHQLV